MADKDAFGRERDEDPLAAMGWSDHAGRAGTGADAIEGAAARGNGSATRPAGAVPPVATGNPLIGTTNGRATAQQAAARQAPVEVAPGSMPGAPGARRLVRALLRLTVMLAIVGTIAAIAVPRVIDAVDSLNTQLDQQPFTPGGRGGGESDQTPPVGLQKGSLLLRGNLVPALSKLRQRAGGRVRLLHIQADRIDAQVITAEQHLRNVQYRFTGETQTLSDVTVPGLGRAPTFAWSQINASAPRRIARSALRGRPSKELDYLVLTDGAGPRWSAFLTDGSGYVAGPDGRGVHQIGG